MSHQTKTTAARTLLTIRKLQAQHNQQRAKTKQNTMRRLLAGGSL